MCVGGGGLELFSVKNRSLQLKATLIKLIGVNQNSKIASQINEL